MTFGQRLVIKALTEQAFQLRRIDSENSEYAAQTYDDLAEKIRSTPLDLLHLTKLDKARLAAAIQHIPEILGPQLDPRSLD